MQRHRREMCASPSTVRPHLVAALALLGCGLATYLALDQLGVLRAWDPILGAGTQAVLHSPLSRALPVPDAAVGAVAYAVEAVTVVPWANRWQHTLRVVYVVTGLALGAAAVILVLLQAFVIHAWCTLCLASAAVSLILAIPAAADAPEVWRRRPATRFR
jgi:uncharacterized membrane protein